MNELFNLVGEYLELFNMLTEGEEDEQVILDTLEGVEGEIENKAEGMVAIINRLDMEIDACKKHRDEWSVRLKRRENAKNSIKRMIMNGMEAMNKTELKAGDVKFKLQNAGGVLPIVYDETKTVPERFTKLTIETDGKLVREALDKGEELDFAHFGERSKVLKIK